MDVTMMLDAARSTPGILNTCSRLAAEANTPQLVLVWAAVPTVCLALGTVLTLSAA
jgi:hypothetical protein